MEIKPNSVEELFKGVSKVPFKSVANFAFFRKICKREAEIMYKMTFIVFYPKIKRRRKQLTDLLCYLCRKV